MPQFMVDEDVAALVEKLAKPKPFENLTFNAALKRVLENLTGSIQEKDSDVMADLEKMLAEAMAARKMEPKKVSSPNPGQWADSVPELKGKNGLSTWQAICDYLNISTGGDSARRRLKNWVKENKPEWPEVPGIATDYK